MTCTARLLLGAAALLLLAVYALPLWRITLDAPQYPEGIGLVINVNSLEGQQEGNLASINGLNHYIGMKAIDPDAIPELKILPWAFGALVGLGLLAAALGKRALHWAWLVLFALVMVGSLVRFYQWGYDYGHDLDPKAAIKVPGMAYQPPLIGSKKILNFTAHSWPASGGYAAAASFLLGAAALWADRRARRRAATPVEDLAAPEAEPTGGSPRRAGAPLAALLLGALALGACQGTGPKPLDYGMVECTHCRMTVSDTKFGAQLVTRTGKAHVFDSAECLAAYAAEHAEEGAVPYVTDFEAPGTLVPADSAFFLRSDGVQSPMGGGLAAFATAPARDAARARLGGTALSWAEVQALPASGAPSHAHR